MVNTRERLAARLSRTTRGKACTGRVQPCVAPRLQQRAERQPAVVDSGHSSTKLLNLRIGADMTSGKADAQAQLARTETGG